MTNEELNTALYKKVFAEIILGREAEKPPVFYRQRERMHTELLMPELSGTTDRVEKYLQGRGIHPVIIRYCLDNKLLFESAGFHSAVFVGYDKDRKTRYGALRSTASSYKGELTGSDKHFSFSLEGKPNSERIHVFESAIGLLSFATLALLDGHYYPFEEKVCIVCNDEGKYNGMRPCRAIYGEDKEMMDISFGPFFICDCSTPNFGSLNKEQLERYKKLFQNPEHFFRVGGEIKAVPYKPKKDHER